ncbi:MAG: malto-oligosyltrehalose trehalohydrolase [Planctomycetota bacterium]
MSGFFECDPTQLHHHLGARPNDGGVDFTVWAPTASQIELQLTKARTSVLLEKLPNGIHHLHVASAEIGDLYMYRIDGGDPRPDPASRFQPDGVHGPSEIVSHQFAWTDGDWKGLKREDLVIYELHVGAFTRQGTFLSAIDQLDELVELGITAIEMMPVSASAGKWNWGYDGVAFFAPSEAFGRPEDLRRLVDEAHRRGLAVFLDVVYNHLGPEGNYLGEFGPYLSQRHRTVWGEAPNFDDPIHGDAVRRFFLANALHWIDEYHLDGLRVDAIHSMKDDREPHIASELASVVSTASVALDRTVLMIAESNVYDPEMTVPREEDGIGFDAMWCDDFLHSVFACLRPDEQLSNRRYFPGADLEQTMKVGFVWEGTLRRERERSNVASRVETHGLVYSIQNHDFIGNHPLGLRLHQLVGDRAHRAAAALMLLQPAIPMLFMGEEFACENPFRFFVDFGDPLLRQAVVEGRRREYPQHDWDSGILPTDPDAFYQAKIGDVDTGNFQTRQWYRELIAIRHRFRKSGLLQDKYLTVDCDVESDLYCMRYDREHESLSVNIRLGTESSKETVETLPSGHVILASLESEVSKDGEDEINLGINDVVIFYKS